MRTSLSLLWCVLLFPSLSARAEALNPARQSPSCGPTVDEVRQKAVAYAGAEDAVVGRLRTRMRLAPLLPHKLDVKVLKDTGTGNVLSLSDEDKFTSKLDRDDGLSIGVQGEWDLTRLVYDPDEIRLLSLALNLAELRISVVSSATRLLLEWRQARMALAAARTSSTQEQRRLRARLDEVETELDNLTGGWFAAELKSHGCGE